ncbi:MAG: transcriptional regulator [Actinomycetota bacterium]|jgi:glycine cleavage system transcriptional repressor|nr:transcriptional regulator [Actinomycetota bacterium]
MTTDIVFTLTGADRVGVVQEVTSILLGLDANIETSRMVRLGGEFAVLMLLCLPEENVARIEGAFAGLAERGFRITTSDTDRRAYETHIEWPTYRIEVQGADHEGIIHEISQGLARRGITIESVETSTTDAPMSGTHLFSMTGIIAIPPSLSEEDWAEALASAGQAAGVDVTAIAIDG